MLYALSEATRALNLRQRLARALHRLAYSQGLRDEHQGLCSGVSHEELSHTLCASRQSISKELKMLEGEGCIALRYGRILVHDLDARNEKYET